jgi:hypothetical protein
MSGRLNQECCTHAVGTRWQRVYEPCLRGPSARQGPNPEKEETQEHSRIWEDRVGFRLRGTKELKGNVPVWKDNLSGHGGTG